MCSLKKTGDLVIIQCTIVVYDFNNKTGQDNVRLHVWSEMPLGVKVWTRSH